MNEILGYIGGLFCGGGVVIICELPLKCEGL